jgi:hypothetical protein
MVSIHPLMYKKVASGTVKYYMKIINRRENIKWRLKRYGICMICRMNKSKKRLGLMRRWNMRWRWTQRCNTYELNIGPKIEF